MSRITFKIKTALVLFIIFCLFLEFHENNPARFRVIPPTNRQTDTQTDTRHHRGEYSIIASMGGRKNASSIAAAHLSRNYKPR